MDFELQVIIWLGYHMKFDGKVVRDSNFRVLSVRNDLDPTLEDRGAGGEGLFQVAVVRRRLNVPAS